ncbi:FHA domain-containing protein [Sorangium sp. So ce131]|uniref:FHA domain-containing protein n=1 Tax=Sorangium sp. So ce131 TaxID=3133282 RepID=UPI003F6385AB
MAFRVAVLYAPIDEPYMQQFDKHLQRLKRGFVRVWHTGQILPGNNRDLDVADQVENSRIVAVLVSADYLAMDECHSPAIYNATVNAALGIQTLIPIIARSCNWEQSPLGHLAPIPDNANPISQCDDQDAAWKHVAAHIAKALSEITSSIPGEAERKRRELTGDTCDSSSVAILEVWFDNKSQIFYLQDFNSIGRLSQNSIVILHPQISRRHCIIAQQVGGFFICDLNSSCGTSVNGNQLTATGLRHGDNIMLGSVKATFRIIRKSASGKCST